MFRTGLSQNHNLNLQGGNDKATYYLSGSYTTQEGITVDAKYNRFSFKGNGTYKLNKYVKVGFNSGYTYSKIHTADDSRGGSLSAMGGLTRLAYVDLPNVPSHNEDGTFYASTLAPRNLGKGNNAIEVFYYNALGLVEGLLIAAGVAVVAKRAAAQGLCLLAVIDVPLAFEHLGLAHCSS